jgi:hypothetical protein
VIKQAIHANQALDKMAQGYQNNNLLLQKAVDEWADDSNELIRKFSESIRLKVENPNLKFSETYPIKEFESIHGNLTVVGLSPYNDTHIFEMVNENSKINEVNYYYYDEIEKIQLSELITKHTINFFDVRLLWQKYK